LPGALLRDLWVRLRLVLSRGVVVNSQDDGPMQLLQVRLLSGELLGKVENLLPYGFSARPMDGAEVHVGSPAGERSRTVAFQVCDRRYRIKALPKGEVALYDQSGNVVHLKNDGTIAVQAVTRIDLESPLVRVSGKIKAEAPFDVEDGDPLATAQTMAAMRLVFNAHTHTGGGANPPATPM